MIMKAVESKLKKEKNHGKRKGKNDGERMSQFHGPLSCNGNWPSSARREKQAVNKGSPKNCSPGFTLTAVVFSPGATTAAALRAADPGLRRALCR